MCFMIRFDVKFIVIWKKKKIKYKHQTDTENKKFTQFVVLNS